MRRRGWIMIRGSPAGRGMKTVERLIGMKLFRLSIGIIPLLLFTGTLVMLFTQQQEQIIHRYLLESAAQASLSVDRAVGEQIGLLKGLSVAHSLDNGDFDVFRLDAQRLMNEHPEWRTVIVTDAKQPLFNIRFQPGQRITPLRDPQSLQRVWETKAPYAGDLSSGFVALRVPVIRADHILYTLVVPVEPHFFLAAAHTSPQKDSRGYIIVGSDGVVITSSENAPAQSGQVLSQQLYINDSSVRTVGDTMYSSPNPIKTSGWQLILYGLESEIRAPFEKMRLFVYAGGFLAATISVIMVFFMEMVWVTRHEASRLRQEIAARLKIEEDLRQSELSLKEAHRLAEIGSWRWNILSHEHIWSDEVYRIYGIDRRFPPTSYPEIEEYFTQESWTQLSAAVEEGLSFGRPYECDAEVIREDGSHRWITIRGEAVRGEEGSVIALRGTIQDITERKKAEDTLQKNRQILELFIEHAPAAIAMFDTGMRYISVSHRFLADYRIENRQVIGRSHYELFPEIGEEWKNVHRRCLLGVTERCVEDPFPRADGTMDWISWEIRPWFEQSGKVSGIILFSEVVTEQVNAVKKLKESEIKFRDLFDKHSAVKIIVDPENGNIIDANQAAENFYGWSGEQLRRMKIQNLDTLLPEQVDPEIEPVAKVLQIPSECSHRVADGTTRDVAVYSSAINIQGKSLIHSIIHDISARKQAEREQQKLREQLIQAQKMESIGQLAGGVAHDYNNMLSVIIGYTEMVMEKTHEDDPSYGELEEIHKAALRSIDITRQLLTFARKQAINPEVLDLNTTVASMLKMLRRLIGENIDLCWLPGADSGAVEMDPTQLDQILVNLCVNARDAIAGVGKITIETGNTTFDEAYCADHFGFVPGQYVVLAVSDDGSGMDQETLARIFEPFFTTKGIGAGTGLGLATVFGIVKQNNGCINVYSEPGNGTTFKLYFPRHGGQTNDIALGPMTVNPEGQGETLLLVEDEVAIGELGRKMLQSLGYQVLIAERPSEAIRLVDERNGKIDLLITDVVMPEMNGRELADHLHERYPNIKVLFMSGYTSSVIVHQGVLDQDVNFLPKPFSMFNLALKVHKALGRE